MKLCLGTVQFGMDYGIRGQKKPALADSIAMLDYAVQNGIDAVDTAAAYGTAEEIVGEFLAKQTVPRDSLFISSKLRPNDLDDVPDGELKTVISRHLDGSLCRLQTDYLDSYLLHSSRYAFNEAILEALYEVKREGKVRHCGVSVYYPGEARQCLNSGMVDFIQLPFSIFDQRMLNEGVFELATQLNNTTQIHSRSAFIQGLILMREDEVPPFLSDAKPMLAKIDTLCREFHISRIALALLFVKHTDAISHLVFGVDNMEQLKENIRIFESDCPREIISGIAKEFSNIDANIMMPSLWVKK